MVVQRWRHVHHQPLNQGIANSIRLAMHLNDLAQAVIPVGISSLVDAFEQVRA